MKTNKGIQPTIPLLILAGVLIIALGVFTVLTILKINETSSAIQNEEQLYQEHEEKLARLELLALMEDDLRQDYERLSNLIPTQADEDKLIHYISGLSEMAGLEMDLIRFEDRVVNINNNVNAMPLSLAFKGSYPQMISLIRSMAAGERLMIIDQINIQREEAAYGDITISMKARAFYR